MRPLSHLTVIDYASGAAGSFAAMLFCQGGATVYKVRTGDKPETDDAIFTDAYLNSGKIVVSAEDEPGLRSTVDVAIADPEHDWAAYLDGRRVPVTGTVHSAGPDGPKSDWHLNEMMIATLGGATVYSVTADGTPAFGFGERYQRVAGMYLYTALLAVLHEGSAARAFPQVQVSELETVVSLLGYSTTQFAYNGSDALVGQAGPRYTLRCTDGYIVLGANGEWANLTKLFSDPELATDPRFLTQGARFEHAHILGRMVTEWAAAKSVAEAIEVAAACTVPVVPLASTQSLLDDDHLRQRDAWETVEVPGRSRGRAPRAAALFNGRRLSRSPS
ncbi:CoA transferase [Streptomyces canus]|uniref:CoA transferase n=1 Tax=Streptomyces canus TaxID=58343 RepID=UPI00369DF3D3